MILKTRGGPVEFRSVEWGTSAIPPRSAWMSDVGLPVTESDAFGLPAVSNVVRSAAAITASLPFFVYNEGDVRTPARDSWQWKLLHDQPSGDCSSYDFFYDVALSLESCQNAFIRKTHFRSELAELEVLDPHRVTAKLDRVTGERLYDVWVDRGNVVENLTRKEILHVRGFTPSPGGYCGVSLIQIHANTLAAQRAMQKFEGDYFRKGGIPPFWFTGAANPTHAKEIKDSYMAARERALNGEPGGLWGQIDVKSIPISMQDAQYAEAKNMSVEDACAIWDWPVWMVTGDTDAGIDTNARMSEFLRVKFLPRLRRIERAFAADPDLFSGKPLYGEFLTAALERADFVTRTRGYKDARQGSWITANEIRKWENLPPIDGGDELQLTPVGGAPNPGMGSSSQEPRSQEDEDMKLEIVLRDEAMENRTVKLIDGLTALTAEQREMARAVRETPPPSLIVKVPEQTPPTINVQPAELRADVVVNVPESIPVVNVTTPEQVAPVVNVHPEVRAEAPVVNVRADAPTPIVNITPSVEAPDVYVTNVVEPAAVTVEAPNVTVEAPNVEVTPNLLLPDPQITVNVEQPNKHVTFKRGPRGEIVEAEIEEV